MATQISFNQIPGNLRIPGVFIEVDNTRALQGLPQFERQMVVVGQKTAAGTATAGELVLVSSVDEAVSLFGAGSLLHRMFVALKENNRFTKSYALPLDDAASGVAASGNINFTGSSATEKGTLNIYIGGQRVRVAVANGDNASTIATNVVAAITADPTLPVTAAVNGVTPGQVDITAKNKGDFGNDIDFRLNYRGKLGGEVTPAGVTATITQMAGGSGNPDITNSLAALPDEIYDYFVIPYTDSTNLDAIDAELEDRWGPMRMLEGHAFSAKENTVSNLSTFGNGRNSEYTSIIGYNDSPTPPYEWAAAYAGQVAAAADIDPARPFQTLELKGVLAPPLASRFSQEERNTLLFDGIATHKIGPAGEVFIERAITTYQKNASNVPDASYLDTNTMLTLSYIRQVYRTKLALKFPRYKLANDDFIIPAGQAIVRPKDIKHEMIAIYGQLMEVGVVENIETFKQELVVVRNASDPNRVDALLTPDLMNQLRIIGIRNAFLL